MVEINDDREKEILEMALGLMLKHLSEFSVSVNEINTLLFKIQYD